MNMHAPQSVQAETELQYLPAIPWQIISPAKNSPVIGIFQDSLLGSYYFTRPHVRLTLLHAMELLAQYTKLQPQLLKQMAKKINSRGKRHEEEYTVSSFDILSQIFPPMTTVNKTNLFNDDKDKFPTSNNVVEIQNGHYLRGQLEKSMFASTSKGILHRICNDFGNRTCADFIDDIQNIINEYMKTSSFSVGISDLIANKTTQREITRVIETQKQEVQLLIEKVHLGIFENKTANSNAAEFELQVNNLLNKALGDAGKIGRSSLGKDNRFVMIVDSGSKGSPHNISQMISCFGQQNIDGKRIPNGFDNRPLPHFCKYDDSPKARGFIENSYITGLTAVEVFYHAMGGRIGLIDTAVKSVTWETPIIIIENQKPKYIEIGKWIDAQLEASPENVEHHTERQLELMNISEVYIPTTNEHGEITWGEITAITRHDPGDQLYEIKTTGGRSVIVTESKSLLIWNPELREFHEMLTPDIRVGDCVPVTAELAEPPVVLESISETCSLFGFENDGKLSLNEENGIFIGTYLFENADKLNSFTESFINNWFSKHSIECTGKNDIQLHDYLVKILGKEASEKHVPIEAYLAPECFVQGLLNGYFSENGIITEVSIEAISASKRLVEDINMLCSRLGIFGEISQTETEQYRITIRAQWGKKFTEKIQLIDETKNAKLQSIVWDANHLDTYNNVVLDKIMEINLIDVKDHPKMYDLTIPSTLNFGLANGLQVRDTSQTGYIQRRWVKAMEDLVVRYDMTVRNNMGKIIQFKYGDDGFDPVKVECQNLSLLNSSIEDIFTHYDMIGVNDQNSDELSVYTKGARSRIQAQRDEARIYCRRYIDKMIETRDFMVEKVFRGRDDNWGIRVPVMFKSIIDNLQGQLGLGKMTKYSTTTSLLQKSLQKNPGEEEEESLTTVTDITPLEAFQLIEEYYQNRLMTLGNAVPNKMFETLYYYYLNPKTLLIDKRFHRKALEQLLETVVQRYKQAIVHPGEAVGIIAGQSAGELSTQASLNSFHTAAGKQKKSNMTTGVPRIEELLQLTKTPKTPSLTVFLKPMDETNAERTKAISLMIEYTKLSEIVKGVRILFDPQDDTIPEDRQIIRRYELFEEMIQQCNQDGSIVAKQDVCEYLPEEDATNPSTNDTFQDAPLFPPTGKRGKKSKSESLESKEKSKWVVRLEMDAETMLDKNITMDDISFILNQHYGGQIVCVYSDYNDSQLIFRIRLTTMSELKEAKNKKILDKSDEVYILKQFMNNLLENTVLRGIPGIVNVMQREMVDTVFKENGKYTKKNTWVIDTTGSNLQEVLGLDFIDASRTYSNNVREVAEVLGIEAAVQVLSLEMAEVLPGINNHHLSIIVDKMSSLKNMCPVFRSGIFSDNVGPLMKSSFEMHSEVLLNAARHGEFDNTRGISASVMLGQPGYFGTSSFQVLLDMKEMEKLKESKAMLDKDRNQALAEGFGELSKEDTEDYCSKAQVNIANHLSLVQAQDHGDNCMDDYDMGF